MYLLPTQLCSGHQNWLELRQAHSLGYWKGLWDLRWGYI